MQAESTKNATPFEYAVAFQDMLANSFSPVIAKAAVVTPPIPNKIGVGERGSKKLATPQMVLVIGRVTLLKRSPRAWKGLVQLGRPQVSPPNHPLPLRSFFP